MMHIAEHAVVTNTKTIRAKLRICEMLGEVEGIFLTDVPLHLENNTFSEGDG
jgi:hypothetical protein